ncbi:fungal-specific transcription factor domain-containing protein [Crucibulum laeve]|uniref:Fungal-specific transcription factor domain-containing protein n=1 Tax=Crucibulum laeve TaxID=68775 RepID=A0A5C3ME64_9AGAR|nr:fungal-specific transcription factor domain-containing protein [Crucibulum laeve]
MGQRIRQLEDTVAIFQSGVSSETHPLLREELLSIKFGPEKGYVPDREQPSRPPSIESSIQAFGTMTIGDRGEGKYFGPSAGSETLLLAGAELEPPPEDETTFPVSLEIARLSASFPFGADGNLDKAYDLLLEHLPSQPRAWSLCETYMEQAAWAFRPIKRDEIIDEILSPTYKALKERQASGTSSTHVSAHKLAVLFLVFALGTLVDLTLEPFNQEAETYYHLSRGCLALRSVFDSPETATVQAVSLMAVYHGMAGKRYTMDSSWTLTSLGAKLAQSIGLHRDSARWNMDAKTVQRRRSLFWELFSSELFYSLALGRPPSIRLSYVDCEFPEDDEATIDANGNTQVGYYQWKYEFTKEIFASVLELTLTAKAPQYQTILDLDRKVREKTLPPHLNVFMSPEDEHCTPSVYMRRCLLGQYRSVTLLYIHRSFFAQAMLDHPANPLRSPYAPSFLAAYRCASGVIKSSLNHYDRFPDLCGRWWGIWTHLFSAAIIVGCIVTRSPSSSMASSAFIELGLACDLFEKGAVQSRRARSGLAILYKMRDKAFQVYSQFRSGNTAPSGVLSVGRPDYGDDELALFGGQTRVLVSRLLSTHGRVKRKQSNSSTPNTSSPASPDSGSKASSHKEPSPDVHPSLVEYLSTFPPTCVHSPTDSNANVMISESEQRSPLLDSAAPFIQEPLNMGSPQHQQQTWSPWPLSASSYASISPESYPMNAGEGSGYDTSFSATATSFPGMCIKTDTSEDNLVDLGMMMSGESGMDEQWMSFMRDTGLLSTEPNGYPVSYDGGRAVSSTYQ